MLFARVGCLLMSSRSSLDESSGYELRVIELLAIEEKNQVCSDLWRILAGEVPSRRGAIAQLPLPPPILRPTVPLGPAGSATFTGKLSAGALSITLNWVFRFLPECFLSSFLQLSTKTARSFANSNRSSTQNLTQPSFSQENNRDVIHRSTAAASPPKTQAHARGIGARLSSIQVLAPGQRGRNSS